MSINFWQTNSCDQLPRTYRCKVSPMALCGGETMQYAYLVLVDASYRARFYSSTTTTLAHHLHPRSKRSSCPDSQRSMWIDFLYYLVTHSERWSNKYDTSQIAGESGYLYRADQQRSRTIALCLSSPTSTSVSEALLTRMADHGIEWSTRSERWPVLAS